MVITKIAPNDATHLQANVKNIAMLWEVLELSSAYTNADVFATLGFSPRQGQYYANALYMIGLSSKVGTGNPVKYVIKDKWVGYSYAQKVELIKSTILQKSWQESVTNINNKIGKTSARGNKDLSQWVKFANKTTASSITSKVSLVKVSEEISDEADYSLPKAKKNINNQMSISTMKDKTVNHNNMMIEIIEYAKENEIHIKKEHKNVDLISKTGNNVKLIEVKSYDALYLAIGQLLNYKYKYKNIIFKDQDYIYELFYVSTANYSKEALGLLNQLKIKHVNISQKEQIFS